jgi:site-specific DNA-methyltransferase (adenine-specific)
VIAPPVFRRYDRAIARGKLYHGDACAFLSSLQAESAGIVFLDPPFNLGKRYVEANPRFDRRPEPVYEQWMEEILNESVRVLAPGGALYLYHLPIWAMRLGHTLLRSLEFRHWIAVSMKNGFVRGERLYPAHYALLYFTKGKPATFTRPKLTAARCRHCNKPVKDYGGYKSIVAEKGLNLSDVWEDLSPVRHKSTKKRKTNQLPLSLTSRVVHISGKKDMLLVDPFAGSGSTVVSAAMHGLRFAACDIVAENCGIIDARISELRNSGKRSNP